MKPFAYSVERVFEHPAARLWDAWTDAAQLQWWYHPTVLDCVPGSATSEARVGGRWAIAVDVPDNGFVAYFYGIYSVVEPYKRLEHSLYYTQSHDEWLAADLGMPSHDIVIEFEPRTDGTWVKFSQFGELPAEQVEATQDGMESYFDSLETFLG